MADEQKSNRFSGKIYDEAELFRKSSLFLVHLRKHGRPLQAAREAGFENTEYINTLRRTDKEFSDAYASVLESRKDLIEDAIIERAVHGVEKPVMFQGRQVDDRLTGKPMYEKTFSDGLLTLVAKAEMPEKYGEKAKVEHHHTGKVGVAVLPMVLESADEWEKQSQMLHQKQDLARIERKETVIDAQFSEVKKEGPVELKRG